MGIILSRFRKEKTTFQKLEILEEKIKSIEAYTINTQRKQKRIVGNILVISVGLNIIAFIVYYLLFFPPLWTDRIIRASPLFIFPLLIILLRNFVAWYFQRKVNNNSQQLSELRTEKKELLEKVMEKETYKVAVEILNRFGEKPSMMRPTTTPMGKPQQQVQIKQIMNANQSAIAPKIIPRQMITPTSSMPSTSLINRSSFTPGQQQNLPFSPSSLNPTPVNFDRSMRSYNRPPQQSQRTPFPVINFEGKGVLEKMVDFLIGDGPSNRFAMICKECHRHNGMALEEEFYYTPFQCIYCGENNPAKKLRPVAPTLPSVSDISRIDNKTSSSSSTSSEEESEESEKKNVEDVKIEEIKEIDENISSEKKSDETVSSDSIDNTSDGDGNVGDDVEIIEKEDIIESENKTEVEKKTD